MAMDDRIEGWHILLQVLGRLDGKSLATTASVSRLWSQVASQEELWKDLCLAKWPSLDSQAGVSVVNEAGSYRQLYALRYQAQRGCLGHIKPWLSMDDLIFLVDVTAGAEEVVCSFIRRGSELCPVFVCDEMFRFLATLREEEQGKAAVGGFGEMKGLKVSWAVMVKGSQKVFQVMDSKSAGKAMMGNACINFSENLPDHPGCAPGFSQHVAEVDLRFSAREDGNLVTSEVCLGILNTLTWRYFSQGEALRYLQHAFI